MELGYSSQFNEYESPRTGMYSSSFNCQMPRMNYSPARNYMPSPPKYGQCQINSHPGYKKH